MHWYIQLPDNDVLNGVEDANASSNFIKEPHLIIFFNFFQENKKKIQNLLF